MPVNSCQLSEDSTVLRKISPKFNCSTMFATCRRRVGRKRLPMQLLNSQRTVFETSLPSFKDFGTEHKQQLESPDLSRHAFLPHLAYTNPLVSAFPSKFLAGRVVLYVLSSGSTLFLCPSAYCHGFLWQKFFDACNLFSTFVYAGELPCSSLHCKMLKMLLKPELHGPGEQQDTCDLLLNTRAFPVSL